MAESTGTSKRKASKASKVSAIVTKVSEIPSVKLGLKTTEFGTAGTLITYLVVQNQVSGDTAYVYAAAIVAGAYILGRSILKALEVLKK